MILLARIAGALVMCLIVLIDLLKFGGTGALGLTEIARLT